MRLALFTLVVAVAAAIGVERRTDSWWLGQLAFLAAADTGLVVWRLAGRRFGSAGHEAVWPAAATGFAFLFASLGVATWANFFASFICASALKRAGSSAAHLWRRRRPPVAEQAALRHVGGRVDEGRV